MIQNYKISISKNALKFINKQDVQQRKRILMAINKLPFGDVKKLKGNEFYRLRIGDIRVLFTKNDEELVILVVSVGNRSQIYENM